MALLGRAEAGEASAAERALLRAVTPLAKLTTGKQAVAVTSEVVECFGGAGYVEDTGVPALLRDAQVLPIWEGTTNVLALEALRALAGDGAGEALAGEIRGRLAEARDPALRPAVEAATGALGRVEAALAVRTSPALREGGARRTALTLGRTLALAHLVAHAQWCLDAGRGRRALAAARRFARSGVDLLGPGGDDDLAESALLAGGEDQ